jgi:2-desacetyl-2-hydroxyethyl bacteriochlorophyllide A dehydrogenase
MKAAVLEDVKKLIVKDIPKPELKPNEILIKVAACGICGTDVKLFEGKYSANTPVVLGHEYAGEVVETGNEVSNISAGDRVVPDPNESCGVCTWCRTGNPCFCSNLAAYGVLRDGGFAEYAKVTEKGAYKIPAKLDYESASFTEPVSCAVHCIDRADIKTGETVLIIGGGAMGQIILQLARSAGAGRVIMVTRSGWKLELAQKYGATHVINAKKENVVKKTMDITGGLGADTVIEAVGSPETIEQSLSLAKRIGKIVIFGFTPEGIEARFVPFDVLSKELTIMGSWVNPYTFQRALEILESKKIDVKTLISNTLPIEKIKDGLQLMKERPEGFMKALVKL